MCSEQRHAGGNALNEPVFSLIVATRNRPHELRRFLLSLSEQTMREFDVIIMDQSDEDQRHEMLSVAETFKSVLRIQYHLLDFVGLSYARNRGMQLATGKLIAFPDDDCWYAPEVLERVCDWFDRNEGYDFMSGVYTEPGSRNPFFPRAELDLTCWNVFRRVSSVTLFFRRAALNTITFDERLGAGTVLPAAEEIDLVVRLLALGCKGKYNPSIAVYHKVFRHSLTAWEHRLKKEKAEAFMMSKNLKNATGISGGYIGMRLILRLVKDVGLSLISLRARRRLRERVAGVLLAWAGGSNERGNPY